MSLTFNNIHLLIITLLALTVAACSTDDMRTNTLDDVVEAEDGILIRAHLAVNVNDFNVSTGKESRELTPDPVKDEATDDEKRINDLWVFQYDAQGNLLINPRYYTISAGMNPNNIPVLLKPDVASTIYVVTNTGSAEWADATNRYDFATIADLEAKSLPNVVQLVNDQKTAISIPMCGYKSDCTLSSAPNQTVNVDVDRMFAKIKIKVAIKETKTNWEYYNIIVENIAPLSPVGTRYGYTSDENNEYYSKVSAADWFTQPHTKTEGSTGDYDFILYVPENIQGINTSSTDPLEKTEKAPNNALKVYVEIKYKDVFKTRQNKFTVYPGGNNYNDYNVQRNYVYNVLLQINNPEPGAVNEPSANCIVVIPNEPTRFEPYYRTEKGGGYSIDQYINEDIEGTDYDPDKVIAYMKIIWQTEGLFGDNSDGSMVRLVREEYGQGDDYYELYTQYDDVNKQITTHDYNTRPASVHKRITKIEVKTLTEGNGLIGAYNSKGDIIWSWHIWSTNLDPGNIGRAQVYTTYYWDNTGIYPNRRVPGYGIMPCNLGALASDPGANYENNSKTYGMLYQWGRKDPFPPVVNNSTGTSWKVQPYDYAHVLKIFDNKNTAITDITHEESTATSSYLFRSLSGNTIKSKLATKGDAVKYTIAHPTVYLCGTKTACPTLTSQTVVSDEINSTNNYHFKGDWNPDMDDCLWGGTPPAEAVKKYNVGGDEWLYDNYGEKSIFDPCPKGWRVPPDDLWLEFTVNGLNPNYNTNKNFQDINVYKWHSDRGMYMYLTAWRDGPYSYFPQTGSRRPDGCAYRVNRCGNYHPASATNNNKVNCLHIHSNDNGFMIFETSNYMYHIKSIAGPIRCVRDRK